MSDSSSNNVASFQPSENKTDDDQETQGDAAGDGTSDVGGVAGARLKAFVERIERLEEEKVALMEDIKEVYAELKGVGFDAKTVRKVVSLRKMDAEKRQEAEQLLDLYKSAIGLY